MNPEAKWGGDRSMANDEECTAGAGRPSFSAVPTTVSPTDIEVLLTNLQALVLALRSNTKISGAGRLVGGTTARVHPLLANLLTLQRELWHCLPNMHIIPIQQSPRVDAFQHFIDVGGNSVNSQGAGGIGSAVQRGGGGVGPYGFGSITEWAQATASRGPTATPPPAAAAAAPHVPPLSGMLSEQQLLAPFCDICSAAEVGETVVTVALSSLIAIVEARCGFLTVQGLAAIMTCTLAIHASDSAGTIGASSDRSTHELLLSRVAAAHLACLQHPAGAALPEKLYVEAARSIVLISIQPLGSPLLKRVTEAALKNIVTTLYQRVVERNETTIAIAAAAAQQHTVAGSTTSTPTSNTAPGTNLPRAAAVTGAGPHSIGDANVFPSTAVSSPPQLRPRICESLDGAVMMHFISQLIMGGAISGSFDVFDAPGSPPSSGVSSPKSHNNRSLSFTESFRSSDSAAAVQLEGLCLAQQALLCVLGKLRDVSFRPLLRSVQSHLCRALLVTGVHTKQSMVLSLIVRTIHLVAQAAAEYLVPQIYSFLRVLHLNPLSAAAEELQRNAGAAGSPVSQSNLLRAMTEINERREILLESLAYLCAQGYFCRFCYTNYDLSSRYAAILPTLCDVLLYQACGRLDRMVESGGAAGAGGAGNGAAGNGAGAGSGMPANLYSNAGGAGGGSGSPPPGVPLSDTHLLAMQATVNLIMTLNEVYRGRNGAGGGESPVLPAAPQCRTTTPDPSSCSGSPAGLPLDPVTTKEMELAIHRTVTQKNLLVEFCTFFAENPAKKGIPFLREKAVRVRRGEEERYALQQDCWLVLADPAGGREVGECLYRLSSLLDKRILGEYIGEQGDFSTIRPDEGVMVALPDGREVSAVELWEAQREEASLQMGTASFFDAQLRGFISQFDFQGRSLLHAIRELVYRVCLPGESQKIDRIMEVFALSWYESNPPSEDATINPFTSDSTAFVLSFAIIMLNTDLHSGKMNQSMSFTDFHRMSRQADEGQDIPEAYLREVYDDVKAHEIIMADMMDKGFTNDVTWNLEMGESLSMGGSHSHASSNNTIAHTTTTTNNNNYLSTTMTDGGENATAAAAASAALPAQTGPGQHHRSKRAPRLCFWDVLENSRSNAGGQSSPLWMEANQHPPTTSAPSGGGMNPCLKTPTHSRIHHHKGVYWRTVVELDPPAQQLLSRYVFASVWKRALLLFTGMIRQMSLQLSSVPAVGEDLTESTAYVSQIAPIELSALLTGVRGLTAMVIVARRLAVPEVVDYSFSCLLTTLNGKAPNSFPLELTVLSKDLPRMLCAREVFALLPQVAPSLSESWHAFAQLVINLFAMGAFALTPAEESKTSGEPTALSRALPEALHRHPLVRLSSEDGAASSANSSTSESNNSGGSGGGGGGWFSSLLSLANTGKRSRDVEQQQQALMSLRGCVPNIHTFLDITARVPPAAHQLLVRTVCEASTVKFKSPADVRTFSYIFSLLCAMVADRSRTNPAALHTLPIIAASPLAELYTMIEKKLPMDESGLQTALEMSAPGTHTPLDSPVLWLRVLRRVVDGVLSVLAIAMRYRGAADVELLQHLIHLLHAAPKRVYGPIVLTSLLKTVGKLLQEEEEQEESLQRHSTAGEFNPALRALVLTYQRINWERDTSVLDGYETLVCHLAMRERYDPRQQVEELLEVVFAVGMMREKARRRLLASNGHVSSRRSTAGGKQGVNQPADGTASWLLNAFSAQGLVPSAAMALTTCCRSTLRRLLAEMAAANGEAGGGNASDLRLDALRCMGLLSPSSSPPPGPLAASRSVPARREDISVVGYLQHLWLLCLKALGALAMRQSGIPGSGPAPGRPGSEDAMWGLECCVMEALPALRDSLPFLLMLYKELLFPLAETIAVSGSASGAEGEGAAVQHDAPVATSTTLSEAEVIIDRCFYNYWADTLSPPEPTKCRLIRLLPQPILRCSAPITAALATAGLSSSVSAGVDVAVGTQLPSALMVSDQLFNVWKQLLTVLLQFHHTYTQRTTGSPPPEQQVMECVQETVKNMVRAGLTLSTEHVTAAATAAITTTTTTTATTTTTTIPPVSVIPTVEVQSPVEKVESEASAAAQVATADAAVEGDSTTATAAPRSPPPSSLVVGQEAEGASLKPQPQPPRPCAFLVQRREYWTITMEMLRMFSFAAELITEVQQATGIAL